MITLSFTSIWIPIVVTISALIIPFLIPTRSCMLGGIDTLFYILIGLSVVAITWPSYVFIKWI